MSKVLKEGIGEQTFIANLQPQVGDRKDFILRVIGPNPEADFQVPMSISGTALSIWGNPDPVDTAESLGVALFRQVGTASPPPENGYWFDSYNSEESLEQTIKKIPNSSPSLFIKNFTGNNLSVNALGAEINNNIQEVDALFSRKFGFPFFKSLEDISEESQRVGDLNSPATDNANYLYKICILSGIIDHFNTSIEIEHSINCEGCEKNHSSTQPSLKSLNIWLENKIGSQGSNELTTVFQMVKKLRKQYPIHDHYITANNIRNVRKEINEANEYFGIVSDDHGGNSVKVINKFSSSLKKIIELFD